MASDRGRCTKQSVRAVTKSAKFLLNPAVTVPSIARSASQSARREATAKRFCLKAPKAAGAVETRAGACEGGVFARAGFAKDAVLRRILIKNALNYFRGNSAQ